jgi:hypothetical protein
MSRGFGKNCLSDLLLFFKRNEEKKKKRKGGGGEHYNVWCGNNSAAPTPPPNGKISLSTCTAAIDVTFPLFVFFPFLKVHPHWKMKETFFLGGFFIPLPPRAEKTFQFLLCQRPIDLPICLMKNNSLTTLQVPHQAADIFLSCGTESY